jgi:hypothetical protein
LRDGVARPLVKRLASFSGAPAELFHSTGDERIVVGHFYRPVTNFLQGSENPCRLRPKLGAMKEANPGLAFRALRAHHVEFPSSMCR